MVEGKGPDNRRTALGLHRDHPRPVPANPAELLQLGECLPHSDQPRAPAGGINHHIGQRPIHLLSQLVAQGLLALNAVRLLQGGHLEPPLGFLALADDATAIAD